MDHSEMNKQLDLGLPEAAKAPGLLGLVRTDEIHVQRSTFLNGLANRVHRWFRLTPSFGPELVHEMFERLELGQESVVLDPFSGAGTTIIESKLEGRTAVGFEINPLLHFVNEACLEWGVSPVSLRSELNRLKSEVQKGVGVSLSDIESFDLSIPPIHNPTRWWRPDVLVQLLFLRRAILETEDGSVRKLLLLALAGVLVPDLTNVTLGKLQLHFIDRTNDHIDVWQAYAEHVELIAGDLEALQRSGAHERGHATCYHQNSLDLAGLELPGKVSGVITSPPYPNRYSYVWNTRPHLYMLGLMENAKEASDLDKKTIGGTWGTATSELSKGVFDPINLSVEQAVLSTVDQIRQHDNMMANYVMHYFNRLTRQIIEMERIAEADIRLAYVVGNSWIKGVYVETDVILANIIDGLGLGYKTFDIHRFRRRHSGVRLYETIVYARK